MSNVTSPVRAVIVQPEEGTTVTAFGDSVTFKLDTEQTGGALSASISTAPPGGGPPLHRHGHEDEFFFILEGRLAFFADGAWTEGGPGTMAYLPKGQAHTFKNVGDATSKMLILTFPSGFERFFTGCAQVFSASAPPDMAKILAIAAEHQIEFLPESK